MSKFFRTSRTHMESSRDAEDNNNNFSCNSHNNNHHVLNSNNKNSHHNSALSSANYQGSSTHQYPPSTSETNNNVHQHNHHKQQNHNNGHMTQGMTADSATHVYQNRYYGASNDNGTSPKTTTIQSSLQPNIHRRGPGRDPGQSRYEATLANAVGRIGHRLIGPRQ